MKKVLKKDLFFLRKSCKILTFVILINLLWMADGFV